MQATNDKPRQISALLVAALLTVTTFAVTASAVQLALPGFGDDDEFSAASHGADILFNLTNFEQRAPLNHGSWVQSDDSATQTDLQYTSLLVADAGQVGGPDYRDVVFRSDLTVGENNNIVGFAFGLALPTGAGTKIDSYILDWGGEEQTHSTLGHTKPEGFTLYHIEGQLPADGDADFDDQQFACYWAKNDTNCTSATIDVIATNHGLGTGWDIGEAYELSLRVQEDVVRLNVAGGQFGTGQVVIDAPGTYEAGEFALYNFRQPSATYSNVGYNDDIAPTIDLVDWCGGGAETDGWCTERARFRAENEEDLGSGVDTVECFIDGVSVGDCRTNTNINEDGEYLVEVVVTDVAGNSETVSAILRVDTSLPTFDLVTGCGPAGSSGGWCADFATFSVDNASSASGIESIECFVDGVSVGDCSTGNQTTGDGVFLIEAVVTSGAGHIGTASATVQVDATLPELSATGQCATLMFPADWCRSHVALLSDASALSGIDSSACGIRADHKGETEFTEIECGDTFSEDGEHTLYVNATSVAGHFNETTATFKLDSTAPIGQFITPEAGVSYLNGQEIDECLIGVSATVAGHRISTPACIASGTIDVVVVADDPINNQYNTGIWKVEFWDGVGENMFKIEDASIYGDGDGGFYNFTWDTTRAPSPSEPHFFQKRTLEVRIWDIAGNFEKLERTYFVLPPL